VWSDERRLWVRNLRRDPRVAFSVQEPGRPFGAVTIRGTAEVQTGRADLDEQVRRICRRYLAEHEVDGYLAAWSQLHTIVRIEPAATRAWSQGY
jgi:general stress protein 26